MIERFPTPHVDPWPRGVQAILRIVLPSLLWTAIAVVVDKLV